MDYGTLVAGGTKVHDTEDKAWWVEAGRRRENAFVEVADAIGLRLAINPEKDTNPYAIDLVMADGSFADLKCQTTPFFTAQKKFQIPPRFCVTFNEKDYRNYVENKPDADIYWWVHWEDLSKTFSGDWGSVTKTVKPLSGVWRFPFPVMAEMIRMQEAERHEYGRRVGDLHGNARESYGFDVREWERLTSDDWVGPSPSSFDPPDDWTPIGGDGDGTR